MIYKTLERIWLLDELQYWIDSWTKFNAGKRHTNFGWIQIQLFNNGDYESASVAEKARRLSIVLPF
jgi:hypothetical protein